MRRIEAVSWRGGVSGEVLDTQRRRFLAALAALREDLRPRVLIIDDNAPFVRALTAALAARGVVVDACAQEAAMRALLRRRRYALLVVDSVAEPDPTVPMFCVTGRMAGEGGWQPQPGVPVRSKLDDIEVVAAEIAARVFASQDRAGP